MPGLKRQGRKGALFSIHPNKDCGSEAECINVATRICFPGIACPGFAAHLNLIAHNGQ
jgi:hypothetical protein